MSTHAAPVCPRCASDACRESRWRSHAEKEEHPGRHPYRCLDCAHRFIAPAPAAGQEAKRVWVASGLISLLLLGAAGALLTLPTDEAAELLFVAAPTAGTEIETVVGLSPATRQAAEAGDLDAQFRLGRAMLQDTSRGKEGAIEAVSWLKRAATGGHAGAMVQLGKLYRTGVGIVQNYALAAKWIRAAAEAGDPEGMVELGRLYRSGIGLEPDTEQAYIWFNRAAAGMSIDGAVERDSIALQLSPEQLKAAQARSLADETAAAPAAGAESDGQ